MNQDNIELLSTENLSRSFNFNFKEIFNSSIDIGINNDIHDSPYRDIDILSNYYSLEEFIESNQNETNISLLSLNIQSLASKFNEFSDFHNLLASNKCKFDIMALQETFSIVDPNIFGLNGYNLQFRTRTIHKGGGVAFYVSTDLHVEVLEELSVFQEKIFESLFIKVHVSDKNSFIIGNIYRSPSTNIGSTPSEQFNSFLDILSNILDQLSSLNQKVYLVGDFNCDLIRFKDHPKTLEFIDKLFSCGFIQLINHPTRISQNRATLIDHCWTNYISNEYKSGILTMYLSDHFPIFHILSSKKKRLIPKTFKYRDYSTDNINSFKSLLSQLSFADVMQENDANLSYDLFHNKFFDLFNIVFEEKEKKFNRNVHKIEPWMSLGLLTSRLRKDELSKIYSKTRTIEDHTIYNTYKNLYNKLLKNMRKLYYQKEIQKHQGDLKNVWQTIKEAAGIKTKSSNLPSSLNINGNTVKDNKLIAEEFNKHFSTIAEKIKETITPTDKPPDDYIEPLNLNFQMPQITPNQVISTFKELKEKKSCDYMDLSSHFMKNIIELISSPLSHIFNRSIETGVVPKKLKISKVHPVFKSGSIDETNNYRPISLISLFGKLLEKIVCNHLSSFLLSNNIIDKNQFGFQQNHSTTHPMIHLLNKITTAINNKEFTIGIFCDLTKAFDMVPIRLLLKKLSKIGINGTILKWFQNYLTERQQFVQIGQDKSSLLTVDSGVPQGSILGPILFLIFFNDLPRSSLLYMLLFCDDTTILASGKNLNDLVNFVNIELRKISQWFRANGMSLHPVKTRFTIFHTQGQTIPWDDINLVIDENDPDCTNYNHDLVKKLEYVNNSSKIPAIKFLGIYFDPTLNFKYHIDQLSLKLSKALFILRRSKKLLDKKSMISLYYSLFHCHLVYGILIYSTATPSNLSTIITKQKMAIRCIMNSKYNAHTAPLFKELNILPFNLLVKYFQLQFMHNYKMNYLPRSFLNIWETNEEFNNYYPLRNILDYRIPRFRIELLKRLPFCHFPKIWNDFDCFPIKILNSKNQFKNKLKVHLIESINITCSRLLCPVCHLNL